MRISDLLFMCIDNLRRRKLRTVLTVLGVVIGTASVVCMTSLGLGFSKMNEELYDTFGGLTQIQVREKYSYDNSKSEQPEHLTDAVVARLSSLQHVKTVAPELQVSVILKQGLWECNTTLRGVPFSEMEKAEIKPGGHYPTSDSTELLMGNQIITFFTNSKTGKGYWGGDDKELPDVDYKKPLFIIYDTDSYYSSKTTQESDKKVDPPKKYLINVAGESAGGEDDYNLFSYEVCTDIDALRQTLKSIFKKKPIPGQPLTRKGKPLSELCYSVINVYCDSMDNVMDVQKQIQDMGFDANSNMEWLEQSQQQSKMIQQILGGIGAISLLVAAIGIANTMMMSIYERTKEIGIMKVLGCDINEIRNMFLIESGFIGLIGGAFGVLLSFIISLITNHLGLAEKIVGRAGNISELPLWLALVAIAFATVISMLAGLMPALKAMKLSPLTAIKNE